MVIHDLRNPAESIQQGLEQAKQEINDMLRQLIRDTNLSLDYLIFRNSAENSNEDVQSLNRGSPGLRKEI